MFDQRYVNSIETNVVLSMNILNFLLQMFKISSITFVQIFSVVESNFQKRKFTFNLKIRKWILFFFLKIRNELHRFFDSNRLDDLAKAKNSIFSDVEKMKKKINSTNFIFITKIFDFSFEFFAFLKKKNFFSTNFQQKKIQFYSIDQRNLTLKILKAKRNEIDGKSIKSRLTRFCCSNCSRSVFN